MVVPITHAYKSFRLTHALNVALAMFNLIAKGTANEPELHSAHYLSEASNLIVNGPASFSKDHHK
jgi:hypothetical protein